ncbi:hypothetical protein ESCO106031_26275 [Escherichia coli]|nr:Uncharacterised protein [Escherichia coli]
MTAPGTRSGLGAVRRSGLISSDGQQGGVIPSFNAMCASDW